MSEWRTVNLGDCCEITSSKRIFYNEYVESGVPFYRSKEIIEKAKGDVISNPLYISQARYDEIKGAFGIPQKGDLLLTAVGSLGIPYLIKDSNPFYFKDGNLIWFRSFNEDLNSKFLYFWFKTRNAYQMLDKIAIGSAQKALTISSIKQISLEIPVRETQNRIVSILSRYDSLIENYQRQIKLLEEAAQRLYKEWFVDLHFPGHENTPIIDGIPEGWEKKTVGEIAEFKRGKTITKKDIIEGSIPVVAGGLEPAYYCNKSNTGQRVITVSGSGANAGFTRMYFEKVWASDCSFIDCSTTEYLHFIYCYLIANKSFLDNLQKGAAQPHVYAKDINALVVLVPSHNVINSFESLASKIFDVIASKNNQIRNLTEARDRLLPKFMNGEIEVS